MDQAAGAGEYVPEPEQQWQYLAPEVRYGEQGVHHFF